MLILLILFYKTNNEHNSSTKSEKLEHDASMHKHKRKKRIISKSRPSHKEPGKKKNFMILIFKSKIKMYFLK